MGIPNRLNSSYYAYILEYWYFKDQQNPLAKRSGENKINTLTDNNLIIASDQQMIKNIMNRLAENF